MRIYAVFALALMPCWTTVPPLFYSEIVKTAEQIIEGRVTRIESRFEEKGATIRTYVTLEDLDVAKGKKVASLTLRLEGGRVNDRTLAIARMPKFVVGRRYLAYVAHNGDALSPIVGFDQGLFEVTLRKGKRVLRNAQNQELVAVRDDRFVFAAAPARTRSASLRAPALGGVDRRYRPAASDRERSISLPIRTSASKNSTSRNPASRTKKPGVAVLPNVDRGAVRGGLAPKQSSPKGRDRRGAVPLVLSPGADTGERLDVLSLLKIGSVRR